LFIHELDVNVFNKHVIVCVCTLTRRFYGCTSWEQNSQQAHTCHRLDVVFTHVLTVSIYTTEWRVE